MSDDGNRASLINIPIHPASMQGSSGMVSGLRLLQVKFSMANKCCVDWHSPLHLPLLIQDSGKIAKRLPNCEVEQSLASVISLDLRIPELGRGLQVCSSMCKIKNRAVTPSSVGLKEVRKTLVTSL